MQVRFSFYAIAVALAASAAPALAQHAVSLDASTPTVDIAPRSHSRSLRLPPLEYEFALTPACATPLTPQSVTVTVADTKTTLGATELADSNEIRLSLTVPAEQIAPVTVAEFCSLPDTDESAETRVEPAAGDPVTVVELATAQVTIAGTLSASASLRCGDGQDETIVYATELLDVTLNCSAESPATGSAVSSSSPHRD